MITAGTRGSLCQTAAADFISPPGVFLSSYELPRRVVSSNPTATRATVLSSKQFRHRQNRPGVPASSEHRLDGKLHTAPIQRLGLRTNITYSSPSAPRSATLILKRTLLPPAFAI